jgi:hypothetical protein
MTGILWSLFDLNGTASRKRGWLVLGLFVPVPQPGRATAGTMLVVGPSSRPDRFWKAVE